ncbi:MAG: M1 family aminopeptidase [Candidatus Margulisiibacteriota bacterium]
MMGLLKPLFRLCIGFGLWMLVVPAVQAQEPLNTLPVVSLSVTINETHIVGTEKITWINPFKKPVKEVYLWVNNQSDAPNPFNNPVLNDAGFEGGFQSTGVKILSCTSEKGWSLRYQSLDETPFLKRQRFANAGNLVKILLPEYVYPGDSVSLQIGFTTALPKVIDVFAAKTPVWRSSASCGAMQDWYPTLAAYDKNGWRLNEAVTAGQAFESVTMVYPKTFQGAFPLFPTKETEKEGQICQEFRPQKPFVWWSFALLRGYQKTTAMSAGITLQLFSKDKVHPDLFVAEAKKALNYYQSQFGPYPQEQLTLVQVPGEKFAGIAEDGMIFLGERVFDCADFTGVGVFERLSHWEIARSVAHQWAGVSARVDAQTEAALSGGLASYMAHRYFEYTYGPTANLWVPETGFSGQLVLAGADFTGIPAVWNDVDAAQWEALKVAQDGWTEPLVALNEDTYTRHRFYRTNTQGFLAFLALENKVERPQFDRALRQYFSIYDHQEAHLEGLQRAVEQQSGQGLNGFFREWFYTAPKLDLFIRRIDQRAYKSDLFARVVIGKKGFAPTTVVVTVVHQDGSREQRKISDAQDGDEVYFSGSSPVQSVSINDDITFAETNRLNNGTETPFRFNGLGLGNLKDRKPGQETLLGVYPFWETLGGGMGTITGLQLRQTNDLTYKAQLFSGLSDTGTSAWVVGASYTGLWGRGANWSLSQVYDFRQWWDTQLSTRLPLWQAIESGHYGKTMAALWTLDLGLRRLESLGTDPYYGGFLALSYDHPLTLDRGYLRLDGASTPQGKTFFRVEDQVDAVWRLFPNLWFLPHFEAGYGQRLPSYLAYNEADFRGLSRSKLGNKKIAASAMVFMPFEYRQEAGWIQSLLRQNLGLGVFVESGSVWDGDWSVARSDVFVNAGIEIRAAVLVGPVRFPVTIGYAHNLRHNGASGTDSELYCRFFERDLMGQTSQ